MTDLETKKILLACRPGSADASDPDVVAALELIRQSPALQIWYADHCAVQEKIRVQFNHIVVPEALKEQIISEHNAELLAVRVRRRTMVAALAVLVLVGIVGAVWLSGRKQIPDELSFATYQKRLVSTVLRSYGMDVETNDIAQIRSHFAQHDAVSDWELTKSLEKAECTGCGVLKWQGKPVSMVCFRTGKPLEAGQESDLFLFVIERSNLREAPETTEPVFASVNKMTTVSWTSGGKTYVLAAVGNEALLRSYL